MNLTVPVVSSESGPQYAVDVNETITIIDSHDHSDGYGVQIGSDGLNIDSDLPINSNNLTSVRSLRLDSQVAPISGTTDKNCIFDVSGDLYFNNGAGNNVRITNGNAVNGANFLSSVWTSNTITSNLTVSSSDQYIAIVCKNTSAIHIQLPAASAVSAGRFYVVIDDLGNTGSAAITLLPAGSDKIAQSAASISLSSAFGSWFVRSDGTSNWDIIYTGFSGLTASGLTYGNTVTNSNGISVGATPSTDSTAALRASNNKILLSSRNAANSGNIAAVATDSSNNVNIGDSNTHYVQLSGSGVVINPSVTANSNIALGSSASLTLNSSSEISYVNPRNEYQIIHAYEAPAVGAAIATNWAYYYTGSTPYGLTSLGTGAYFILPIHPRNGATLTTIDCFYQINNGSHSPANKMSVNLLLKQPNYTYVPTSMFSGGAQPLTYSAFGSAIESTFSTNQNNVIDTSTFAYWALISEESGTSSQAGNYFFGIRLTYSVSQVTL